MDAYQKIEEHRDTINALGAALMRMQDVDWVTKNGVQTTIGATTLRYYEKSLEELEDAFGEDKYALQDLRELLHEAKRHVYN